jgi:hypothetical protein
LTRHAKKRLKLHIRVAVGAGDGCASREILIYEGPDDALLELLLKIHDVVRKIQMLSDALGVINIIERTAAMLGGAVTLQFREAALIPELHGQADNGAALLLQKSGDRGTVYTAAHGDSHDAGWHFGAGGQNVELGRCNHQDFILPDSSRLRAHG